MDDLLQEFIAETRETLEALSGEIVAWESDPSDRHRLDAIFRFVHTVKGSCGCKMCCVSLKTCGLVLQMSTSIINAIAIIQRILCWICCRWCL